MSNLKSDKVDKIVQCCFDLYNNLPKNGKPIEQEWTVLSCVVLYDTKRDEIEVVSLGTGSKCIGASKMSPKGDVLNDSHAEIIARRGFLLYLYDNIEKCLNNQSSIFVQENRKFNIKEHIEFVFYSSQLPCGDASIMPKSGGNEQIGDVVQTLRRKAADIECESKKTKIDEDIYRTGAKCLLDSVQDPKAPGSNYHIVGQVRTKPGRGDKTLSVSCSDKMARWIHIGIQGSLLHMLCDTIHIKHFIFGANVPYSVGTLTRALLERNSFDSQLEIKPEFYQTSLPFMNIRTDQNVRPAAGSIVWSKFSPSSEVAVQGKKLGMTKKKASLPSNSLCISKYHIYRRFIEMLRKNKHLKVDILGEYDVCLVPYNEMKRKATEYSEKWKNLKEVFFTSWTLKPDMWDFCINTEVKN